MGFFDKLKNGLAKTKNAFFGQISEVVKSFRKVDEDLLEELEELMICADMGAETTETIIDELREQIKEEKITDADGVLSALKTILRGHIGEGEPLVLTTVPSVVLVIGVNGVGKTTSIGKIAARLKGEGKKVIVAAADTFRAAAIEQLQIWGERSGVDVICRDRGADPASVCYEVMDEAERRGSELVLIDTAGRLHTSPELMRELAKVVNVTRKRSNMPVTVVLVVDATTGQNGLNQAREFNQALDLDGLIVTKLDGTAKGGIVVAISHELDLPIWRIGVGEGIDDLQPFDALEFSRALVGETEV